MLENIFTFFEAHPTRLYVPLIASVLFILALRGLSSAATSRRGNLYGIIGMILAVATKNFLATILMAGLAGIIGIFSFGKVTNQRRKLFQKIGVLFVIAIPLLFIFFYERFFFFAVTVSAMLFGGAIGFYIAKKIEMTSLPQLVAAFHSLVGLAAVFIACSIFIASGASLPALNAAEMSLGAAIGAVTFTGSVVAFGKLHGFIKGRPLKFQGQHKLNLLIAVAIIIMIIWFVANQSSLLFASIIVGAFVIGYLLIIPIGGADMPVIVSMLNSYSGWAAAGIGFTLQNNLLIIVGALVGTSGAILSNIMCKGMNRSLLNVILGGVGANENVSVLKDSSHGNVKLCSPEDASFIIKNSSSVIVVPGYGMAVSQAQHAIKELADILKIEGISIKYAIHPVAGRMPGHMNVLLAESNIPYDDVFEIDEINHEFGSTDVAIVIGANDITNSAAKTDSTSPIYGMPILDVEKAKTVLFIKRSLGSGYAGIDNPLFYKGNTMMILGDAKKVVEDILKAIK